MRSSQACQAYVTSVDTAPPPFSTRRLRCEGSPLREDARLYESPERDEERAGEGHHPELTQPSTARPTPALIPLRQGTVRLAAAPGPGDLNRHRPARPMARLGDPQCTACLPTLRGRRGEASQRAHLLGRLAIPPGKTFHDIQPGAMHANPPQRAKLAHLVDHRVLPAAYEGPPLGLQRLALRGKQADVLPCALQTTQQGSWEW
jgi:hypothetical protein